MNKNISEKIESIISGKITKKTSSKFYDDYHESFQESGLHKAKAVLSQIESLGNKPDLKKLAYVSIGGSEGSEIEYILNNSDIKYGILIEIDTHACKIAHEKAKNLAPDCDLVIIPGDITQQTDLIQKTLQDWKRKSAIDGILVVAHAVLHELPYRSSNFDFNSFFGEMFWDWDPCLFISREPCEPFNWPETVEFSAPGVSSELLYQLASTIKQKLSFEGEIKRCGPDYVSASRVLVTETIHKLFYLDDFDYEIQEKITHIQPDIFIPLVEKYLGKNSVFQTRLNSSSFSRKYQELKISARSEDGAQLPIPLSFFSIVASRREL